MKRQEGVVKRGLRWRGVNIITGREPRTKLRSIRGSFNPDAKG